jgi:hypothetical protein
MINVRSFVPWGTLAIFTTISAKSVSKGVSPVNLTQAIATNVLNLCSLIITNQSRKMHVFRYALMAHMVTLSVSSAHNAYIFHIKATVYSLALPIPL